MNKTNDARRQKMGEEEEERDKKKEQKKKGKEVTVEMIAGDGVQVEFVQS